MHVAPRAVELASLSPFSFLPYYFPYSFVGIIDMGFVDLATGRNSLLGVLEFGIWSFGV